MNDLVRHRQIIDLLRDRPFASVRELQEQLGVSAATIRRDIDKIDQSGGARKVYGGISALDGAASQTTAFARPYDENRDLAVDAKRQIAELASTMVMDGDAVIVNGGSTCYHLGVKLAERNVRLFTNSMPLAAYLGEHGKCSLTIAGGELYREPRVIYSPSQPAFFASKFFLGAQGISADGLLESHPLMVRAIQDLSRNADQVIVLADSRKFSIHARHAALPLTRIGVLITDDGLSDQHAKMLEAAGIALRIAPSGGLTANGGAG
ncbi:MAG: DeoR/GlpR transcriptional regulator [Aquamicrobium sp.]|uniref:DeoR/GlpR family DNA-binding transcription regulator n=1 Tax=Mesorhizobium TaxID=68287 RepID=UPI0010132ACB|nr:MULTISPECIES: DeoR/GlpR family DNA-binding transcription regulator [Mesorhizobium]MBR2689296.1 DeoR/GlpR transcriptional regulator [Aquamicrobium sp.]QAZ43036.1 ArsR family transcriptional regulator [Mesorhizobium sp. Pch-S]